MTLFVENARLNNLTGLLKPNPYTEVTFVFVYLYFVYLYFVFCILYLLKPYTIHRVYLIFVKI